ncbi:MAG: molecular chaperone HtpG [Lentisphaerae bacterium GWF2_44_16]|nr:MAG: molecular chaperone HtpG [Lentisphaerae bacterium GWF2_44_16]
MTVKTEKFKTEVQHLLDLMVHSLYSNKDIFLRELIANASDAIDKARFEALTNQSVSADWEIKITPDKDKGTLQISDNGIGMTMDEVINNIGTIAKSGTKAFLAAHQEKEMKNLPDLIGQFGVGFYSAFMVADKVELVTRKAGPSSPAVRWESKGQEDYTLDKSSATEQGTTITLHLKADAKSYLETWKIKEIVKKYSDFIEYPIKTPAEKKKSDGSESTELEILNSQKAIWLRSPEELKEEDYKNFYSHISHFGGEPLLNIHFSAEGTSEFKALLFLPSQAPFDLFMMPDQRKKTLHLYIRRVFISDECSNLIPEYLRFLKGVVDSSDLPLNVSREILQENAQILKIQKNIVRKVLAELKKLQENDKDKYLTFYKEFGKVLKEGVATDHANKDKILELLMFETMKNTDGKLITLKEYLDAMPPLQKDIYYVTGESRAMLENSPHLEFLKSKGYDVIFMIDPIDEWVVQSIPEYSGKKLKSVGKGDIELDDESKKEAEEKTEKADKEHKNLIEFLKKELTEKVKNVRFSKRLTESACCLVSDEFDPSAHMERIFKAMKQQMPQTKRILELNPEHPLINAFQKLYDKNPANPKLSEFADMLYDQALLTEGNAIPDPLNFSKKLASLMVTGIEKEVEVVK